MFWVTSDDVKYPVKLGDYSGIKLITSKENRLKIKLFFNWEI